MIEPNKTITLEEYEKICSKNHCVNCPLRNSEVCAYYHYIKDNTKEKW